LSRALTVHLDHLVTLPFRSRSMRRSRSAEGLTVDVELRRHLCHITAIPKASESEFRESVRRIRGNWARKEGREEVEV
jgi:hypothetical protein